MTDSASASLATSLRYELVIDDVTSVRRIAEATGFFSPAETEIATELVAERLARGDASGYHFIIAEQTQPIAFACYGPIACTVASFDLYWIAVAPDAQGQGLGRRLMVESEQRIHQLGGRRVYVDTSNRPQYVPTRAFYERCGYRQDAVLADFYAPGDDKVVYLKVLT